MKFKKSDKIQFISTIEGLESFPEYLPKPAKNFIPQWFKDMPNSVEETITVKHCPSFPDYFSQGYIVPMWCDVKLKCDEEGNWSWNTPTSLASWDVHGDKQFLDHTEAKFNGIEGQFVFKAICPWRVITPPGWSVLQLPLFYHFNEEWSVLPGVIDTDIHHEINQQVLYHGNGKDVVIKSGEPFVLYIPFKRSEKLKKEIRHQTEKDLKLFKRQDYDRLSKFVPTNYYRDNQRKRKKDV